MADKVGYDLLINYDDNNIFSIIMKGQLSVNPTFRPLGIKRPHIHLQQPLLANDGHHLYTVNHHIPWNNRNIINSTYVPSLQVIMILCGDWKLYIYNKNMELIGKLSDWQSKYSVGFQYIEQLKMFILIGVTEIETLRVNIKTNLKETKFLSSVKFGIERLQMRGVQEKDRLSWNKGYGYNIQQNLLYIWSTQNINFYSLSKLELKSAIVKLVKKETAITYVHLNFTYRYTITGLTNGNMKVWRVPLSQSSYHQYIMIHNCVHHTKTVERIVPSNDDRIIISSSLDLSICLWSLQTFQLLRVYNFQSQYSNVWLVDERKAFAIQNNELGELVFGKTMDFICEVDTNILYYDKKIQLDGQKTQSFQITLESNIGIQIMGKDLLTKDLNKIDISYFYPPLKAKSIKQIIASPYNPLIYYMLVQNGEMFSVRIQNNSSKIEESFSLQHTQDSENHSLNQTPTYLAFLPILDIHFDSEITQNNISNQSSLKSSKKLLVPEHEKLITIGCSKGSIIVLSLDKIEKIRTRLTYHRESIVNIQILRQADSNICILASFCAQHYLRFISMQENKAYCFLTIYCANTLKFYKSFENHIAIVLMQGVFEMGTVNGPVEIVVNKNLDAVDHEGEVLSLDYEPIKELVLTSGSDNRIKIWSIQKDLLYQIKLDEGVKYAFWSNDEEIFVLHRNKLLYLRNIHLELQFPKSNQEQYATIPIKQIFQKFKQPSLHLSEELILIKRKKASSQVQNKQFHIPQSRLEIDTVISKKKKGHSAKKMNQSSYYSNNFLEEEQKKKNQMALNVKATKRHLQEISAIKKITNESLLPKIHPKTQDKFQQFINAKLINKKMLTRRDITLNRIIMKNLIKQQFSDKEDDMSGLKLDF